MNIAPNTDHPYMSETSQAENPDSKIADVLNLKLLKLFPGSVS